MTRDYFKEKHWVEKDSTAKERRAKAKTEAKYGEKIASTKGGKSSGKFGKKSNVKAENRSKYAEERKNQMRVEGHFMSTSAGFGFVRTQNQDWPDVFISKRNIGEAKNRDRVMIRIFTDLNGVKVDKETRIEGAVVKVTKSIDWSQLEKKHPNGSDMEAIIWQYGLPEKFPKNALSEAGQIPKTVREEDKVGRRDMRDQPLITVDGVDARDLDDAVSATRLENGNYFLSVHIADVAHYVKIGSAIEEEAFLRATSVYLPDRVIPMLPTALSNGICSLNAGVERLAMSCDVEMTPRGKIVNYDIYQSVILVDKRFSYDTVNEMLLDKNPETISEHQEWLPMLEVLAKIQDILERKRMRRGMINFNFPEVKVKLDEKNGDVKAIVKREQRLAEKMIEEAMICANEVVASHYFKLEVPFIYRVHQGPGEEKLLLLNQALSQLGHHVESDADGKVNPRDFQRLLKAVEHKPESEFVQLFALRSMSHAIYTPEALGHFGLASKYYSYFTSPIRRYADLSIHRVIKQQLAGQIKNNPTKLERRMEVSAKQASNREKLAEEAEREGIKIKCCLFMRDKLGEVYDGRVSGVIPSGVFVEMSNNVEGRISVDDLPKDEYNYIQEAMTLKGNSHSFKLGDEMRVQVAKVDVIERRIDLVIARKGE